MKQKHNTYTNSLKKWNAAEQINISQQWWHQC